MEKLTDKLVNIRQYAEQIVQKSDRVAIDDDVLTQFAGELDGTQARLIQNPITHAVVLSFAQKVGLTLLFGAVNYCYVDPESGRDYQYSINGMTSARSTAFLQALIQSGLRWDDMGAIAAIPLADWQVILHLNDPDVVLYDAEERTVRLATFARYLAKVIGEPTRFFETFPNAQSVYYLLINSGMFKDEYLKRLQVVLVWLEDLARQNDIPFDGASKSLTAMADYRLPQVLMNERIIVLRSQDFELLSEQLTDLELERDIRAATIIVCERLARMTGVTEVEIDKLLWQKSQQLISDGLLVAPAMRVATRCY
jgi:hypothetical protein